MPPAVPYGSWPSPITAARIVEGASTVGELRVDGPDVWWGESRPSEGGRTQLIRRTPDGTRHEVLPEGWNARTQVHEYGGGAWAVRDGVVWFSAWADQRLHRLDAAGGQQVPHPITPEPTVARGLRYADMQVSPDGQWIVCVRESHESGGEAVNELVAIPADGGGEAQVLVSGPDFVASPRISPDGANLAWVQWNHPDMPWDATELRWSPFVPDAGPTEGERVAGGPGESIVQPEFTPGGGLLAASDRNNWWNVYRFTGGDLVLDPPEPVTDVRAEVGGPHWVFGQSWYAVLPDGAVVASVNDGGRQGLGIVAPGSSTVDPHAAPGVWVAGQLRPVAAGRFAMVAAGPTLEATPMLCTPAAEGQLEVEVLRPPKDLGFDDAFISVPTEIDFPSGGGRTAHGLLYLPANPEVTPPPGEKPPLLVLIHGGPTSAARPILSLGTQFWTSRGFAVVDVDYGGSTGYGRAFRDELRLQWGIVDVDDCVAAARHLADGGVADPDRLAIRGGSAGGYTTLAALAFRDTFAAGASHYGVADCEALARDTHKFESRYLDGLIGPYPDDVATYRERSPIHHTDGFDKPLIVFQGLEDQIVPPDQAEMIVAALAAKGVPHAYVPFEGEQHGFRRSENIVRALEAELWFYGRVFGFTPADDIAPVESAVGL